MRRRVYQSDDQFSMADVYDTCTEFHAMQCMHNPSTTHQMQCAMQCNEQASILPTVLLLTVPVACNTLMFCACIDGFGHHPYTLN